jgi:hypothetical protein
LLAAPRKSKRLRKHRRRKLHRLHLLLLLLSRHLPLLLHLLLLLLIRLHLLHLLQNKFLNKGFFRKETEATLSLFFCPFFDFLSVFHGMAMEQTKKRHG